MHRNILIGITGNIASGKSSVIKYCVSRGYKIFIADDAVHDLYEMPEVQEKVKEIIPELREPGIDRKRLAEIIFMDEAKRFKLEAVIHPPVIRKLKEFAKDLGEGETGFAEVPLLFEAGMENIFDYVILVHCDREIRLKRAKERGTLEDKFNMIDRVQMSDEKKKERVDFVIDSNVSRVELHQKMDEIIKELKK